MLAAERRLRRRKDFSTAVRTGRRAGRGAIVVHLAINPPLSGASLARAGFIVPRGVGGAVVRNRVRRRLRHLTRERIESLPAGSTLVVRARAEAAARAYAELAADLDAALVAASRRTGGG
ncbi:MAG: ribonuclease P protein component [Micromonosporaceae bacterium]